MAVFIPNPGDNFLDWANNLSNAFSDYTIPLANDPENWQDWAISLLYSNPSFSTFPIPSKSLYPNPEDWKKWAELFTNNIYTQ